MSKKLFNDLMDLCTKTDAFSFKDYTSIGNGLYRIFSYRLASYTEFCYPNAMEARGSMFEIDSSGNYIRVASRTPIKFFNAYENPFTNFDKKLKSTEISVVMDKLDGSIISTFIDNDGVIRMKSHSSLDSEHATNSNAILHNNQEMYNEVNRVEKELDFTVNFEYTSPNYRIVLPYNEDKLTVLNIRNRNTGEMVVGNKLKEISEVLYNNSVFYKNGDIISTFEIKDTLYESLMNVRKMTEIEGYVVILKDGTIFKIKTDWYCALHLTKDSINVDSRLYNTVLDNASDDLKTMFADDVHSIKRIEKMEKLVYMCYNSLEAYVEDFVAKYGNLPKKEFAVKVTSTVEKTLNRQGLIFSLYNGKKPDYKETMQKYMREILKDFE